MARWQVYDFGPEWLWISAALILLLAALLAWVSIDVERSDY